MSVTSLIAEVLRVHPDTGRSSVEGFSAIGTEHEHGSMVPHDMPNVFTRQSHDSI